MKHIYLHIPFCARRCIYCDFSIAVRSEIPARRYLDAVYREREHRKDVGEWDDAALETLYLGGGSPSLLPAEYVGDLLGYLLETEGSTETRPDVTLEDNPENVTDASARAWADADVNRVSLGVQSFDPTVLQWMHRTHLPAHAVTAARSLREAGVDSLSIDLIAALPAQLGRNFSDDLARALELQPDHISVYGLTVEPRTALARRIARKAVTPATDEAYARDFLLAHDLLTESGFEHYEVSNYARQGRRSTHNFAYWDGSTYAGLGPSAHGFDGYERRWNVGPWVQYQRLITELGDATGGRELLSSDQASLERVYLGLRVAEGLKLEEMRAFNQTLVTNFEENGWAESKDGRWSLTAQGWLRLDEIVAALTTSPEGG